MMLGSRGKAGTFETKLHPRPWTGDFKDGLGNKISMLAYANPKNGADKKKRADGYGITRFNKKTKKITFECWPRFCDVTQGDKVQYLGWPIKVDQDANDGRKVVGWLPELRFAKGVSLVVQVIEEATAEVLYTARAKGNSFKPRAYSTGKHTIKVGLQKQDVKMIRGVVVAKTKKEAGELKVIL